MMIKQPGEGFRGVDGHIGYLLRQASHCIRLKIDQLLKIYGITHPQFAVLSILRLESGSYASDIARATMLSRQTVKVIISNLENAGLVHLVAHEIHGRVIEIFLTEIGRKRLAECMVLVEKLEQDILSHLKPSEEQVIREWLVRCALN